MAEKENKKEPGCDALLDELKERLESFEERLEDLENDITDLKTNQTFNAQNIDPYDDE